MAQIPWSTNVFLIVVPALIVLGAVIWFLRGRRRES
jgi:hypothetical protein